MIGVGVAAPHMGEVVDWRSFFRCFVRQTCSRPRAVSAKDVPFRGLSDTSYPIGKLSPKPPHFGGGNGDFQLKRLRAYLGAEETDHNI